MNLFVFDFHGTLEQGTERAVIDISNRVLEQHDYTHRFTETDVDRLYGLRWIKYFEDLLPHESTERHRELELACFTMSSQNFDIVRKHIKPAPYAHEVLQAIAQSPHDQIVISNTQPLSLPRFLDSVDMTKYFPKSHAFAAGNHVDAPGQSKEEILDRKMKAGRYQRVIAIGDSPQDVNLAKAFGGTSYLYAHPWREFKEAEADFRIKDLRDVLREL